MGGRGGSERRRVHFVPAPPHVVCHPTIPPTPYHFFFQTYDLERRAPHILSNGGGAGRLQTISLTWPPCVSLVPCLSTTESGKMEEVKKRHESMKAEYIINRVDWQDMVTRIGNARWEVGSKRDKGKKYVVRRISNGPTACNCIESVFL